MSSKTNTTATRDEATPPLFPKLRFPEFRGAEGWADAPLGTLLNKSPDYGVNAAAVPFTERLPQYLRITDISDDGTYLSDKKVSVDLEPTGQIFLEEGDITLARTGASVGKSYRYRKEDGRLVFAGFLIRVRPNPKRLDSTYLANFLTTNQYWKWVQATSARSGQPGINSTEYASLKIPLPAVFAEQQKIAECLSSVDEVIAAQARKLDALKTHKKGLMQQLFPREGETAPRLRFPEFRDAGEWEMKPFEEFVTKSFYGTSSSTSPIGKYPVLRMGNMVDGGLDFTNLVYLDLDDDSFESFRLEEGDILLNRTNSPALVGKISIFQLKSDCITASYIVTYRLNKKRMVPAFCNCMLNTPLYQSRIKSFARPSVSQANINPTTFKKELIVAVPSPAEQQRIAGCLSSLDALIAAEIRKLEALKIHKRGLMQQLFPSLDEGTA